MPALVCELVEETGWGRETEVQLRGTLGSSSEAWRLQTLPLGWRGSRVRLTSWGARELQAVMGRVTGQHLAEVGAARA